MPDNGSHRSMQVIIYVQYVFISHPYANIHDSKSMDYISMPVLYCDLGHFKSITHSRIIGICYASNVGFCCVEIISSHKVRTNKIIFRVFDTDQHHKM